MLRNDMHFDMQNMWNAVSIRYEEGGEGEDARNNPYDSGMEEYSLKANWKLKDEHKRTKVLTFPNCTSEMLAKRYALASLG